MNDVVVDLRRPPDFTGPNAWCAWRSKLAPVGQRIQKATDGTVGLWLLHCPKAHPLWSYWWLALVHLRDIEGVPSAKVWVPGAGWELQAFAQSPEAEPDPDSPEGTMRLLLPGDWCVQFGEVANDDGAMRVAGAVVDAIVRGQASPDRDFRGVWEKIIPETATCLAAGGHPEH